MHILIYSVYPLFGVTTGIILFWGADTFWDRLYPVACSQEVVPPTTYRLLCITICWDQGGSPAQRETFGGGGGGAAARGGRRGGCGGEEEESDSADERSSEEEGKGKGKAKAKAKAKAKRKAKGNGQRKKTPEEMFEKSNQSEQVLYRFCLWICYFKLFTN